MITIAAQVTTAYKYLSPRHATSMLERGSIRVGTLSEYRSWEGADVRGDRAGARAFRMGLRLTF